MNSGLVQVKGLTCLEAIIKGNAERKVIVPNSKFNHMLLDKWVDYKWDYSWPNHTGTGFAMEAKDKPFGKIVEKMFSYYGEEKSLIYNVRKEDIGARNVMNLFEHQFRQDGEGTIQLINTKTGKQILTVEGLHEADEIILKVVGDIRSFKLSDRDGGVFETDDTGKDDTEKKDDVRICASDSSALGLLGRSCGGLNRYRHNVDADDDLTEQRGVLYGNATKIGMVTKPAKETEFSKKKSLSEPKKDLAERLGDVLHKINRLTPGDTANGEAKVALRELSEVIRQALAERHDMISASDSWWVELAKRAMIAKVGMTGVAELLRGIMKDEKEMELQNFLREYFWIQ